MLKPDFFIIGAPKCGTTALGFYLYERPDVCFSSPKEPNYFCTDLTAYRQNRTIEEYLDCFQCDSNSIKCSGEASTWYMYSQDAVKNILDFNKNAKIIAMLRNPAKVAESLYYQFLYDYEEDAPTFEIAWSLQNIRSQGYKLPKNIVEAKRLQYKEVCSLGSQLERLKKTVPDKQLKIILFDDFIKDTKSVYEEVLDFLNLPADNRTEFPKVNERKSHKSKLIADITQQKSPLLNTAINAFKKTFGIKKLGISEYLRSFNYKSYSPKPLSKSFTNLLNNEFESEIRLIEHHLNRELTDWRK